ncbi:hypothetical protein MPTK1_6g12480 [Marchantia polymorpha subsp. ruderalis]|nr:hypothetical protein MARPO_0059s0099 [Marchantia polymorpha]BBN14546.1 hypothetical protein Mp_6g12480 [Marchantia polymorpha subsp. ruderalis]|eukprot:PTQ37174.1 hypothetical protein MARPO_0059s0099 [Marchantia polymorpha]
MGRMGESTALTAPLLSDRLVESGGAPQQPQQIRAEEENGNKILNEDWKCGTDVCGIANNSEAAIEERSEATKKLSRAVYFCVVFMIIEIIGGIKAGSLAVLTDAVHLSSDVASFAISLFAVWAGGLEADRHRHSFGFYRAEVLGALVSILIIWLITGIIVYEAVDRLFTEQVAIDGRLMFIVASLGLLVNLVMMFLLGHDHGHGGHGHGHGHSHDHGHDHEHTSAHEHGSHHGHDHADEEHHHDEAHPEHDEHAALMVEEALSSDPNQHRQECKRQNLVVKGHDRIIVCICDEADGSFERRLTINSTSSEHEGRHTGSSGRTENVNVRSAYLHVLGDLIQSIGVMIGGAVIWWKPEWKIVDLLCTFLFSIIVLLTTLKMVSDILAVLMESTPREIDAKLLQKGLEAIDGVIAVHELHIWAITVGKVILACHVMIHPEAESDEVLQKVIHYCDSKFNISHVTIQVERRKQAALQNAPSGEGHAHDHDHDHHHHDHP